MQRILNCHLVVICVVISFNTGCSKTSPWSLAKNSAWGPQDFRYADDAIGPATPLAKQEDNNISFRKVAQTQQIAEPDLQAFEESRDNAFKAAPGETATAKTEEDSPGILSKIEMIDPAELTQQIRDSQAKTANESFQLASQWKSPEAKHDSNTNEIESNIHRVSYQETVKAPQVETASSSTPPNGMLAPLAPAAEVVSHPLRPILYSDPAVESEPIEDLNLELQKLPPLNLAAPEPAATETLPQDPVKSLPVAETQLVQSTPITGDTFEWKPLPQNSPEFIPEFTPTDDNDSTEGSLARQVGWSQEIAPQMAPTPQTERKFVGELDRFAVDDSDQVSWQDDNCGENCPSRHVHPIASQIIEDGNEVVPVQFEQEYQEEFQVEEIQNDNVLVPDASFVHPPLRVPPTELMPIREPNFPLPGLSTLPSSPTKLPTLPIIANSDDNAFRLPQSTGDTIEAIPASASLPDDANVDRVANLDVEFAVEKPVEEKLDFELPKPLTWREQLRETATSLQNQIDRSTNLTEKSHLKGKLELLQLLPDELDETQHQYLDALTDLLRTTGQDQPQDVFVAGQTLERLKNAVAYMEQVANLKIVNATFCTKVMGFGQFTPTNSMTFAPGQQILVYCEIENHTAQPKIVDGQSLHSTRLSGSFLVYDANQVAVQQDTFPVVEDLAQQRRQDFYMHIPLTLGQLPPGQYTYQLMVDDVGGQKSASLTEPIQFTIQ